MQKLNEDLAEIRLLLGEGVPLRAEQRILWEALENEIRSSGYKIVTKEKLDEQIRIKEYCGTWETFKQALGINIQGVEQAVREMAAPHDTCIENGLPLLPAL
ncbi:hypothetical protein [Paraflavitalea speifideaquila]|uniref:hypothetical protein n=1 Tax=Paraflavitalea speifideaquila TaxID=3076558 RepID=UPI0028E32F48|nr:hypothetical protein [Paraflavitalea speifideiaquila]